MYIIDLSGEWSYMTDYDDIGIAEEYYKRKFDKGGFMLPGSACENGVGKKREYFDEMTAEAVRAPRERYEYIAPLWLQREIDIPEEYAGKRVRLYFERVNIASQVWIDGVPSGGEIIELSAPHIYELRGITAGRHTLTVRVDNRNLLNIDTMASGYSVDTQGYWNGIIGRVELQCEEVFSIGNITVTPNIAAGSIGVRLTLLNDVHSPFERRYASIKLSVTDPNGHELHTDIYERELYNSRQPEHFMYEIPNAKLWDEFDPALYTLRVRYECCGVTDEKCVRFGMREIKTENKRIMLNGRQIALRGTIDCAIYPLTGYPPTDVDTWRRNFTTIKDYGLNHVRFHAWCPPEAAFTAADELGLYVSVEMPLWLNRDVCALELGEDRAHRDYFSREAITISKTYGNHPSFIMFSCGNENMGDFELLEDIVIQTKAMDSRRIYTLTTNFDHPALPCEDYLCAYEAGGHKVRIQDIQDRAAEDTAFDYSAAVADVPVPIISFEIGQYCVYPDVDGMAKYTGNIIATNLDVIKKSMIGHGVYERLAEYIAASGNLAARLYKEDIEAALRTRDFGGFELLSLCDYTGQSTATVGMLDVFFDNKGIITPEQFRRFCNSVVPLFKARRIFTNDETILAELDLYDHGRTPISDSVFELTVYCGNEIYYSIKTHERHVSIPLTGITRSCQLAAELRVGEYVNSWNLYVFAKHENTELNIINTPAELEELAKNGGKAVIGEGAVENTVEGSFIPVFWSPVHFPSPKPCGAMIDENHPIFEHFPTGKYPDYQWKRLLETSRAVRLDAFEQVIPIVEFVPNFVDNTPSSPLFEAHIGKARIIYCGFDLENPAPEVQAFKAALVKYMENLK